MEAKKYDNERMEAVAVCRKFRRICIRERLYLKDKVSRSEYAHMMNTNQVYLCRKIKLGSGLSLNKFITAIRMTIALQLLSTTNYSMTIVLERCGYSDKSSFYRSFKKRFHCSPNELRKRYFAN